MSDIEKNSKIITTDIREITKQRYLDYAMSVISDRALPDIRDGLKPVHRRILYAMYELELEYNKPYKKSARIVGDVIGKYHPHGDTSVYDAMVRIAQHFSMRMLLVDGQGNFGSVDDDPAAAMRYTEAKFHQIGQSMFKDIKLDTVNERPNYDNSEREPEVLPVVFPNLVINGIQGIAVGMASNIPPHNPIEAMECVKYLINSRIEKSPIVIEDLVKIMPAPDFPTGGLIHGTKEMIKAWTSGRASMKLRAKWHEEEEEGKAVIVIDQLPYQVKKAKLHLRLVELAKPNTNKDSLSFGKSIVEGIDDIRDESDKDGIRLCIVIKPEYDAELVFNQLIKYSQLEESINYNPTVLVGGKPRVVSLLDMFEAFIEHRIEVITRRVNTLLKKDSEKLHRLEGLMKAIDPNNIERVIELVRKSGSTADAKSALVQFLAIDEIQAIAILDLRLNKLTSLELDSMRDNHKELTEQVADYQDIIANIDRVLNIILEESNEQIDLFKTIKGKKSFYGGVEFPFAERLSAFNEEIFRNDAAALTKQEECTIMYSANGYVMRLPLDQFESQNRGTRGKKKMKVKKEDFITNSINCHSHSNLMFISNKGKTYTIMAYELPEGDKGRHINNILGGLEKDEKIIHMVPVNFEDKEGSLIMITKKGMIKRTSLEEYVSSRRKGGIIGINLNEGDNIVYVDICKNSDQVLMLNNNNMSIRFPIENIRTVSRNSKGVTAMDIGDDEYIIGGSVVRSDEGYMVCVSTNGLVKITPINEYRIQKRGGKGLRAMKSNERSGNMFAAIYIESLDVDLVTTTKLGMNNRIHLENINVTSRKTTGVSLVKLEESDNLVSLFIVDHEEISEESLDDTEELEMIEELDE